MEILAKLFLADALLSAAHYGLLAAISRRKQTRKV
jgi:hypothetical protein